MSNIIKTIAFDLGGVLAYRNFSLLSEEELYLYKIYMNRHQVQNKKVVSYASQKMPEIYLKIYRLAKGAFEALELLKETEIRPSIWTNNTGAIDAWFEETNIYRYIKKEDIINSFYIGKDKPSPFFYHKALELLCSYPEDVLFLDDDMKNILGAQKCGIQGKLYIESEGLVSTITREISKRGM